MKPMLALAVALLALPLYAADRDVNREWRPEPAYETTTITTTVEAIDTDARTVTLQDQDGNEVTLYAEPTLAGFDQLQVGDEVTFRYSEPVALQIHKPDPPASSGSRGQTFRGSALPRPGSAAARVTERVTIEDVNRKTDEITFSTEDGTTMTVLADDASLLKDLHRGEPVDLTYTPPLLVSVEP